MSVSRVLPALAIVLCGGVDAQQVRTVDARFTGAVGCKSSSCHGGAGEKRSQFFTWTEKDFHTRAFAILTTARSQRIGEVLGISAAHESNRCTACHAPLHAIAPARLMKGADPREGVSCESCHGAAENWLRGHTRTDWSYATRVGAGMRDLKSFYVRANTCVACHQNLDADIAAAGHPELVFEMDSQSVAQPKHWRDPEGSGVRAWLVGQAVALRETSWQLSQNAEAGESTRLQWNALAWLLHKVTTAETTLRPIEPPSDDPSAYDRVQQQADAFARHAAQQNFGTDFARRLLCELAASDSEFKENAGVSAELLFRRARRLLLALESLARDNKELSEPLANLRAATLSPTQFQPAEFAARLASAALCISANSAVK